MAAATNALAANMTRTINMDPVRRHDSEKNSSVSSSSQFDDEKRDLEPSITVNTVYTSFEANGEEAVLFRQNGDLVLLPAPTQDPRDPLNMAFKYKVIGLVCLCFFGALAASAELILGAMLPVFALEYANIPPHILLFFTENNFLPPGTDALTFLSKLPGAPPIWKTYMLGSMPLLVMGLSNLFLIPLAISIGRRPVILGTGLLAIAGALWSGYSHSLNSHIAGRCLQAIGAGTVESLIPYIIQDTIFFHQRNTYISGVFAAQGTIIIALGIAAPHMIIYMSWRWVYRLTAAGAGFFLIGVFFFLPETRWHRTKSELAGVPRPAELEVNHEPRTLTYNLRVFSGPYEWKKGRQALWDSLTTFFYPHIFFITMLNSAMIATAFAASFIVTPQLLGNEWNWSFLNLGLCLVPVIIAAILVALVTGRFADVVANYFAKARGRRLPENQLINLILPVICAIIGSVVFGVSGQNPAKYHWAIFLMGLGFMAFAFLGAGTVGAVYVLEAYPQLAGPALVNIASFRCILAFAFSFNVSEWIVELGYLNSMLIYTGITVLFAMLLPIVYIYGPAWRKRWPGPDR